MCVSMYVSANSYAVLLSNARTRFSPCILGEHTAVYRCLIKHAGKRSEKMLCKGRKKKASKARLNSGVTKNCILLQFANKETQTGAIYAVLS